MDDTTMELYTKLSRLQWLLQRFHMQTHAEHGPAGDPTRGQGRVLAMLKLQSEIPTRDLAYLLGIRQQSLNELLNKLEKNGFVERVPSEQDRRVMVVKLTDKGRDEQQPPRSDFTGLFGCLSEEEQARFGEYLDRVTASLESQLGADEREEIERWMDAARSRMGDEKFERLLASRGGMPPHWGDPRQRGGRHGDGPCMRGHGGHGGHRGHGGFGPDGRGPAPHDMSGAGRFDPDCDGPMPDGRGPYPRGDRPCPPPPPPQPKAPHDPEDE